MDFSLPDKIRQATYEAEFVNGDETLFHAAMFTGTTGVYTGMRPGAFTLSLNQRYPEQHYLKLVQNLGMLWSGYQEISWINRQVLAQCDDFDCAYDMVSSKPSTSKAYIILGGVRGHEGVVMARDNLGISHVTSLSKDNWYLI